MSKVPCLGVANPEIVLNQAYNTPDAAHGDFNDVPPECLPCRRSYPLDDLPDTNDDREWESILHRLYVQGIDAVVLS